MWVPLVVGVIGLVGVVTAQLISTRRENRSWRREAEREDLRWQRERQRLSDQRVHEVTLHWSHLRNSGYAQLLQATDAYLAALRDHADAASRGEEPTGPELAAHRVKIGECQALIDITGSPRIRAVTGELVRATAGARMSIAPGGEARRTGADTAQRAKDAFLTEIRQELGIDDQHTAGRPVLPTAKGQK